MTLPILLLTGMTPDPRIFDRILPLLPNATVIKWITPLRYEPLVAYVDRLVRSIRTEESPIVCGVSFGGIVARELALALNARACVLISSVRSPHELPPWFRIFGLLRPRLAEAAMNLGGGLASRGPRVVRTTSTLRLKKFSGASGEWHRWATAAVLNWQPSKDLDRIPSIHIHGDGDLTFPIRYTKADMVIHGAGHMLALTHSKQVREILIELAS